MSRLILVTGGFGYVGGRVAQELAASPQRQVVLGSRAPRPAPAWLPGAQQRTLDWNSPASLEAACEGVHAVLHLAAMNEIDAAKDPAGALIANGVNTVRLLQAAQAKGVQRFLFLSTAHVYGAPLAGRIDETTPARPRHPYASSHRAGEDVVLAARDEGRIGGIAVRLSNGFGAPAHPEVDRWTLLVNDLCRQAARERKLVLRSAGLQRRDFVTLHDTARALVHLLESPDAGLGDGLFNLGGRRAMKVIEMAELVQARCAAVLGYRPDIQKPAPAAGETSLDLDYRIDKLIGTGFELSGDFAGEIDATLRFCRGAA